VRWARWRRKRDSNRPPVSGTTVFETARSTPLRERDRVFPERDRGFESLFLRQPVCLSRDFIFVGQKPRLSARVCRAALPRGRQRAAGSADIAPTWGNISVGLYSSTAFPAMRSRQVVGVKVTRLVPKRGRASPGSGCWRILRVRIEFKQSRVRSADRARQAADGSARAASRPSDRAAGAHRESLG
jgi:hypothetical protein